MDQQRTALVLGATGGIGGEVARVLRGRGWIVRALHRNPDALNSDASARTGEGFHWVKGDAMRAEQVMAAAEGTSLIVHAVNPPGYRRWAELVLPMLESTIAAARASGARIVFPGTVYNYGPDAFPRLSETSPQHPMTRKGAIRVEMEQRLKAAASVGVRSLIVRAGDYFGPKAASNNWFAQSLVKPGCPVVSVTNPGSPGVGHQWAYLPDVAETMVRLIEREDVLGAFECFHMDGHWDSDGAQMAASIARVSRNPVLPVRRMPWWAVVAASPFVPLFRELTEMRYLWRRPIRLENARLLSVLGSEPHTPLDDAVRTSLVGLGCLPSGQ